MNNEKELNRKYEMTDETIEFDGHILHRIKALRFIDTIETYVYKDELGGFIECEDNLSHEGDCWVDGDAKVYNGARVYGNAYVNDEAIVSGKYVKLTDDVCVEDKSVIRGNKNGIEITNDVRISDNTHIIGNGSYNLYLCDNIELCEDAKIESNDDILYVRGIGSENRNTTFFKCEDGTIKVKCGCFTGTLSEFEDKVKETHGDNIFAREYLQMVEVVKTHFRMSYEEKHIQRKPTLLEKLKMIKNILKM